MGETTITAYKFDKQPCFEFMSGYAGFTPGQSFQLKHSGVFGR
ncbi:MAG: hypothetical protein ACMG6E_03125 [Candidatus Roizmanbacteria bacterium]